MPQQILHPCLPTLLWLLLHALQRIIGHAIPTPTGYQMVLQLEATSAAAELHSRGWRPAWHAALRLGAQLASAVAALHDAGYVHRDIKPANVLLNADRTEARLADLGLAAAVAELAVGGVAHAKPTGGFHKQHMVRRVDADRYS
jgi:DNA-binding helix-hairpin-helix protein with protein kinase domain